MNEDIVKRRIVDEVLKSDISDGDMLLIDNANSGTGRIPATFFTRSMDEIARLDADLENVGSVLKNMDTVLTADAVEFRPVLRFKQGRETDTDANRITSNIINFADSGCGVLYINVDPAYEYYIRWSTSPTTYNDMAGEGWYNGPIVRNIYSGDHTQYLYVMLRRMGDSSAIHPSDYTPAILDVHSYKKNVYTDIVSKSIDKVVSDYDFSVENSAIKLSDGTIVSNTQYTATNYINVDGAAFILYAGAITNTYGVVCYDEEKVFIKAIAKASEYGYVIPYDNPACIPIPSGAKYVRACFDKNNAQSFRSYVRVVKTLSANDLDYRDNLFVNVKKKYFSKLNSKGVSFIFATDFHKTENTTNIETLSALSSTIGKMASELDLDFVVYGGDYIDVPTRATGIDDLEWFGRYKNISKPFYFLQGNHDTNPYSSEGSSGAITTKEVYDRLNRGNKYVTTDALQPFNNYGYYDDEKNSVRFIFLNTSDTADATGFGYSTEQSKWFARILYDVGGKDNWSFIVFSHYTTSYWNWILNDYNNGSTRTVDGEAFNYNGRNKAKLVALIHGHRHNDHSQNAIESGVDLGYKEIYVNCAAPYNIYKSTASDDGTTYNNVPYSDTETAFSIFYVDTSNRKIYETRYGLGMKDREWNY